jgi:hypothetical protein
MKGGRYVFQNLHYYVFRNANPLFFFFKSHGRYSLLDIKNRKIGAGHHAQYKCVFSWENFHQILTGKKVISSYFP